MILHWTLIYAKKSLIKKYIAIHDPPLPQLNNRQIYHSFGKVNARKLTITSPDQCLVEISRSFHFAA